MSLVYLLLNDANMKATSTTLLLLIVVDLKDQMLYFYHTM